LHKLVVFKVDSDSLIFSAVHQDQNMQKVQKRMKGSKQDEDAAMKEF
jgi:predicted ATP-grasp superfamily ATP-dependent carboligase